jgi:hypothetical protein
MSRVALPACVVAVVAACLALPIWLGTRGGPARGIAAGDDLDRLREETWELDWKGRALYRRLIDKGRVTAQLRAGRRTLREAAEEFRVIDIRNGRASAAIQDEAFYLREVIEWVQAHAPDPPIGPGMAELLEAEREQLEAERALGPPP